MKAFMSDKNGRHDANVAILCDAERKALAVIEAREILEITEKDYKIACGPLVLGVMAESLNNFLSDS